MLDISVQVSLSEYAMSAIIGYRRHPLKSEWLAQDKDATETPIPRSHAPESLCKKFIPQAL